MCRSSSTSNVYNLSASAEVIDVRGISLVTRQRCRDQNASPFPRKKVPCPMRRTVACPVCGKPSKAQLSVCELRPPKHATTWCLRVSWPTFLALAKFPADLAGRGQDRTSPTDNLSSLLGLPRTGQATLRRIIESSLGLPQTGQVGASVVERLTLKAPLNNQRPIRTADALLTSQTRTGVVTRIPLDNRTPQRPGRCLKRRSSDP